MAKGWESKSVEEQQSLASSINLTEQGRERVSRECVEKTRRLQALQLNRSRVAQQLEKCSNDRYRGMLQQELDFLQGEISKFD